jgi:hypothetical protein
MHQDELEKALALLSLQLPVNREQLEQTRRDLLATWHPHRYANLTNNPKRYMQMYKKGESMTKEIQKAYELVVRWLDSQKNEG